MKTINELCNYFYEEFKGLPSSSPIVRNGHKGDAYELVVLKILYGNQLPEFTKKNASKLAEYVISPPDDGIDIFFQHESGDEYSFDVIQVKQTALNEKDLRNCITQMERTIKDYIDNPQGLKSNNCKEVLSKSNLDNFNVENCHYFVVHTGDMSDFSGSRSNETIVTEKELERLYKNTSNNVDEEIISIDNKIIYETSGKDYGAVICSVDGYNLAKLCDKYFDTEIGRNILFGGNLRESLVKPNKKNKLYNDMKETVVNEPEKFWYYNNGITIIAKNFYENDNGTIKLKEFSIVNGAQTTSALGLFLKEANRNRDNQLMESLKKVKVLIKILKIPEENMRQNIAIFNNSQTPISSRDMVANRPEQRQLHEWLMDEESPQIYVDIRRGSQLPSSFNKKFTHRITTNEILAQLAYAAFLHKPSVAKDKKKGLFDSNFEQSDYVINETYHNIFNWDEDNPSNNGVLFKMSKRDIDEVLFVKQLYNESRKYLRKRYESRINNLENQKENIDDEKKKKNNEERLHSNRRYYQLSNISMFYFVAFYYECKEQFEKDTTLWFNIEKYYSDKDFKQKMIEKAADLFLAKTNEILSDIAKESGMDSNLNNLVRSAATEAPFFAVLRDKLAKSFEIEKEFDTFCNDFKIKI